MSLYDRTRTKLGSQFFVPPMQVDDPRLPPHVLLIDHRGEAVRVTSRRVPVFARDGTAWFPRSRRLMGGEAYRAHLEEMMGKLVEDIREGRRPRGLLLMIPGGNQSPRRTLDLAEKVFPLMEADGYHPVFVAWDSAIGSAYVEQLLRLRGGRRRKRAALTALIYFAADLLSGLLNLVPSALTQLALARRGWRWTKVAVLRNPAGFTPPPPNLHVDPGTWTPKFSLLRFLHRAAALPVQLLLAGPFLSVVVPRAWQNLLRRTRTMFRPAREFDANVTEPGYERPDGTRFAPPTGAMALFLDTLRETIRAHPDLDLNVTLIAHSMGSMVANQVLALSPDLPWESVVYMAPACNVRQFTESVVPLLRARGGATKAYVLTLQPRVEVSQQDFAGLAPVGSVLEWLEGFLEPPHGYLDRMLGKWDNLKDVLHVIPDDVRPLIHLKAFSYDGAVRAKPRRHVDFNDPDVPFWRPPFWT